ncbi:MAG TPA: hypothetical protein VHO48_16250, partial [Anaerolineaceae bacterium]|nr:hypothetical protein [Anaerolineaceae bacterium]
MTMYIFPSGFEDQIQKAMDAPEPNPQKMNALREQFVARGVATLNTNHRETTTPRLRQANAAGRSTPKPSVFARRPAWQWAMLAVLLLAGVAFTSPRVVSAFRALLGFLPGVGVVEQSPSALVLAEPVTIERDGFTLTIDQAVSTAEKTVVVYRYTEPARGNSASQPQAGASSQIVKFPALTLPDG